MANDLISRNALLAEYDRVHIGEPGKARKLIENAPTIDAVEAVRCKDCKHRYTMSNGHSFCRENFPWGKYDDDYCSYGERKDIGNL